MAGGQQGAELAPVIDEERGKAIQRRRMAHGWHSLRRFSAATGVSRDALTKAEDGRGSEGTYQRLEAWLDAYDNEVGEDEPTPPTIEQLEVVVEGKGVIVTVKGPVTNPDALEEAVARILRMIREESSPDTP